MDSLPIPHADARLASDALSARIHSNLRSAGGWLGFDQFMQSALYEPVLGYYSGGSRRFGPDGDFITAPELTPLFGHCLAHALQPWLDQCASCIIEFGAGTGQLAAQVLNALDREDRAPQTYLIVEVSPALRRQQQHTLGLLAPGLADRVRWLDELPERIDGVVLANEVLDAMPVRLFELREAGVFERGLVRTSDDGGFAWQARAADRQLAGQVERALAGAGWGGSQADRLDYSAWPPGYSSEIGEQAGAWVRTVGDRLTRGVLLLIDYGFPGREYYHPQRGMGTLACHYRHRVHHDPLWYPGLQDISAHINFTAVADAGESVGLELLGYSSQGKFLLNTGVLQTLAQMRLEHTVEYARQAQAVQKLVSESEMGELFKVIALGRGVNDDGPAFIGATRAP